MGVTSAEKGRWAVVGGGAECAPVWEVCWFKAGSPCFEARGVLRDEGSGKSSGVGSGWSKASIRGPQVKPTYWAR